MRNSRFNLVSNWRRKTEAYLAVSAFSALYRRVKDKNDVGVDTFMRYTLRLLTVDQFQRAARLIISLEYIRRRKVDMLERKNIVLVYG